VFAVPEFLSEIWSYPQSGLVSHVLDSSKWNNARPGTRGNPGTDGTFPATAPTADPKQPLPSAKPNQSHRTVHPIPCQGVGAVICCKYHHFHQLAAMPSLQFICAQCAILISQLHQRLTCGCISDLRVSRFPKPRLWASLGFKFLKRWNLLKIRAGNGFAMMNLPKTPPGG